MVAVAMWSFGSVCRCFDHSVSAPRDQFVDGTTSFGVRFRDQSHCTIEQSARSRRVGTIELELGEQHEHRDEPGAFWHMLLEDFHGVSRKCGRTLVLPE